MSSFVTKRLRCQSLSLQDYADFEAGLEPGWEGFSNPYRHLIDGPNPLKHRIPRVKAEPNFAEIGLILAIEKETNELIGSAGFHDFPDGTGMIEIGFGIVPERQNQGFGTELLIGMWKMICVRPDVRILRYTVSPENLPSMHIIKKLAFTKIGEQMDPEDGLELIYERPSKDFFSEMASNL